MTETENKQEWEQIGFLETEKMKVNGGYLYRTQKPGVNGIAMSFVPDVDLQRYQAHLRDAYNKGCEDGHADAKVGVHATNEGMKDE